MSHWLNSFVDFSNLFNHSRKILRHKPPRDVGMLALKFLQVMTRTATNIYDRHGINIRTSTFHKKLLDRVEVWNHSTGSTLMVCAHMMVEMLETG